MTRTLCNPSLLQPRCWPLALHCFFLLDVLDFRSLEVFTILLTCVWCFIYSVENRSFQPEFVWRVIRMPVDCTRPGWRPESLSSIWISCKAPVGLLYWDTHKKPNWCIINSSCHSLRVVQICGLSVKQGTRRWSSTVGKLGNYESNGQHRGG